MTPKLRWQPTPDLLENSQLSQYIQWLGKRSHLAFESPITAGNAASMYQKLWEWSISDLPAFWESVWEYFAVMAHSPYKTVLSGNKMPDYHWFEGATLNYAEHIFRHKTDQRPALVFQNEMQPLQEMSWADLEQQTASVAALLRAAGVGAGDRVAAFLPNSPHAIVAALAAQSLGAVWSSCSPDFGAASVVDRFKQIEPKVLVAVDGYGYGGKQFDKRAVVTEICALLPSLEMVIFIPYLNAEAENVAFKNVVRWETAISNKNASLQFTPLPFFDHPIWVLYSSGTTGIPKAITHSHGGNLLEHLKYVHLHNDIRPGERFFWFSTTGWMMWNFTLAAMLGGAVIVLYDGSPGYPDLNVLWELTEKAPIHHFGTSAPFLVSCMKAGISPKNQFNINQLRTIGSTGSPLPPEAFDWVYENVPEHVWLSSMAGGTDVCTAWVGGNPLLPVWQGEIQCRCLGCAMESWDEAGHPVPVDEVGEMVVTKPMPSMPVYFWNDPDRSKYHSSYFEHYPGVWRHGDWLRITPRDSLLILGRSDATLNRQGVRIGTAEIYRAIDKISQVRDSLIINLERPDGSDWMPLFVALAPGVVLDEALKTAIKKILRTEYSPRHVPDEIIEVPDIPYTISGKKMETPVKKILQRKPLDKAYNRDSMKNPEIMDFFIGLAQNLIE